MIGNFFKEKFNIAIVGSLLSVLALIVVFIFLNLNSKPHIRFVELSGGKDSAELSNQVVKFYFSVPMDKKDIENKVSISPNTEYSVAWSNNVLFVIFKKNLQGENEYSVRLSSELSDIYGKKLEYDYEYKFKTRSLQIAYIERNPGEVSKIVLSDVNFENKKTLFEDLNISLFSINKEYLAVVTEKDKTNDIKIIGLKDSKIKSFNFSNVIISSIDFSPIQNEIIFLTQKIIKYEDYVQPQPEIYINIYNINENKTTVLNAANALIGVVSIRYSPDGNSILYKTSESFYYLLEISKPNEPAQIDRYLADGGFNFEGNKIVFVTFDPLVRFTENQYLVEFTSERESKVLTDGIIPVLDPHYLYLDDSIIFAKKSGELERTKGFYNIVRRFPDGKFEDIFAIEGHSLELPKPSFDDRYIAMEMYSAEDLLNFKDQRNFLFQTKPSTGKLVIFDRKENKLIDKGVSGINLAWVE